MKRSLVTRRLVGRPAGAADFRAMRAIHGDPRAARWLSADGVPLPVERTEAFLSAARDHCTRNGFGILVLRERRGGRFVGYCGLRRTMATGRPEVELLYGIVPGRWGRGYMREAAQAALTLWRRRVPGRGLVAYTLPDNRRSRGVMASCGFRYAGRIVHAGLPHVLYRAPLRFRPTPPAPGRARRRADGAPGRDSRSRA